MDACFELVEDPPVARFEFFRNGMLVGFATYQSNDNDVVVGHVETLAQFRGNGYADRLMVQLLEQLRESNRTITPLCWFAAGHIRERPDQHDLLSI